jgi:hypothetical protein
MVNRPMVDGPSCKGLVVWVSLKARVKAQIIGGGIPMYFFFFFFFSKNAGELRLIILSKKK